MITGGRLVNKLWNVGRFVSANKTTDKAPSNIVDKWILAKMMEVVKQATEEFEQYNYAGAKRA